MRTEQNAFPCLNTLSIDARVTCFDVSWAQCRICRMCPTSGFNPLQCAASGVTVDVSQPSSSPIASLQAAILEVPLVIVASVSRGRPWPSAVHLKHQVNEFCPATRSARGGRALWSKRRCIKEPQQRAACPKIVSSRQGAMACTAFALPFGELGEAHRTRGS
jgi:hypothetical protein